MNQPATTSDVLEQRLLDQIDAIINDCEANQRPLELDPARGQLFELFVQAEAAGCVEEGSQPDLTDHGICQSLSKRWGLQATAQKSFVDQTKIPEENLVKMRSLWSVMRMWMEWTYAWQRWSEFHKDGQTSAGKAPSE